MLTRIEREAGRGCPRLLYAGDVPVEPTVYGAALLHRLLAGWPAEKLLVLESEPCRSEAGRRLPGVRYGSFGRGNARLFHSRLHRAYATWLFLRMGTRWAPLETAAAGFEPEAVLTVTHGLSWLAAAGYAARRGVPLHLILHDDWPGRGLVAGWLREKARRCFGAVYRAAGSRLCVSPGMAELYEAEWGVAGTVLYPCREAGAERHAAPPGRLRDPAGGGVFACAGTLNSAGQAAALEAVGEALGRRGGTLRFYGPLDRGRARRLGLRCRNLELRPFVPAADLVRRLRQEADALVVPMSFDAREERQQTVSFPSKLADYTGAGLPLLVVAPGYSSAARWARANRGAAVLVESLGDASLEQAVNRLATDPGCRWELAGNALAAGTRFFSYAAAWEAFSSAILTAHSPPCPPETAIENPPPPRISCIIPTLNRGPVLLDTLRQLLAQSAPPHEIILVDQSPAHDPVTRDTLASFAARGALIWLRQSEPNASKARNAGALAATGDVLLFLDDDVRLEPGFIAAYLRAFQRSGAPGVAGQILDGDSRTVPRLDPRASSTELGWLLHFPKNYSRECRTSFLMSGNAGIRRDLFLRLGGMDENYPHGAYREESDFAMRFRRAGYRLLFSPDCSLYHLGPRFVPGGGARNGAAGRDFRYFHHCLGDWYFTLGFATPRTLGPLLLRSLRHFVLNRQSLDRPWRVPAAFVYWLAAAPFAALRRCRGPKLLSSDPTW